MKKVTKKSSVLKVWPSAICVKIKKRKQGKPDLYHIIVDDRIIGIGYGKPAAWNNAYNRYNED
jgi:hypothetical protein